MKKIKDALISIYLIGIPVLAVVLLIGIIFGWIDLAALLSWIALNFVKFCLIVIGVSAVLVLVICCFPVVIIILIGVAVMLIGLFIYSLFT